MCYTYYYLIENEETWVMPIELKISSNPSQYCITMFNLEQISNTIDVSIYYWCFSIYIRTAFHNKIALVNVIFFSETPIVPILNRVPRINAKRCRVAALLTVPAVLVYWSPGCSARVGHAWCFLDSVFANSWRLI